MELLLSQKKNPSSVEESSRAVVASGLHIQIYYLENEFKKYVKIIYVKYSQATILSKC